MDIDSLIRRTGLSLAQQLALAFGLYSVLGMEGDLVAVAPEARGPRTKPATSSAAWATRLTSPRRMPSRSGEPTMWLGSAVRLRVFSRSSAD